MLLPDLSTAQWFILIGTVLGIMALMGISAAAGYLTGKRNAR